MMKDIIISLSRRYSRTIEQKNAIEIFYNLLLTESNLGHLTLHIIFGFHGKGKLQKISEDFQPRKKMLQAFWQSIWLFLCVFTI